MNKLSLVLATVALFAIVVSCADDIFLEPPPSLQGEYEGKYFFTEDYQLPNQSTTEADIEWRFTETQYNMFTLLGDGETQAKFCSPFGRYSLDEGVELRPTDDNCANTIANAEQNPSGNFNLRRPADSIIMTRVDSDNSRFFEIRLKRASE